MKNTEQKSVASATNAQEMFHSVCKHFPDLSKEEFEALKKDIETHGLKQPIVRLNGKIIDGRQRYRAVVELGIEPTYIDIDSKAKPEDVLVSNNLLRRHLSESQRAIIGAKLVTTKLGSNQSDDGVTQGTAAERTGISVDTIQRAQKVIKAGDREIVRLVEMGRLTVNRAEKMLKLGQEALGAIKAASAEEGFENVVKAAFAADSDLKRKEAQKKVDEIRANNKPLESVDGKFGVIYIDPPWDCVKETDAGYPTMSRDELLELDVNSYAKDNAVCFMWAPASQLPLALELMEKWGFEYKTNAVWDKKTPGQGGYFMMQHELLLVGTRGIVPETDKKGRATSIIEEKRRGHSQKPFAAAKLIEQMYPEMDKLEMFCRGKPREGWRGWGNQCVTEPADAITEATVEIKNILEDNTPQIIQVKGAANDNASQKAA